MVLVLVMMWLLAADSIAGVGCHDTMVGRMEEMMERRNQVWMGGAMVVCFRRWVDAWMVGGLFGESGLLLTLYKAWMVAA